MEAGKTRVLLFTSPVDAAEFDRFLRRVRRDFRGLTLTPVVPSRRTPRVEQLLSPRQIEVLREFAAGRSTKEIALRMGISPKTVEAHRWAFSHKLRIWQLPGFVRYALRMGVLPPEWLLRSD